MGKTGLFALNVKRLMDSRGLTQERLAEKAGVSHHTVFRAVSKGIIPRGSNIAKIAAALGVDEAYLFAEPKEEQSSEMHPQQLASQIAKELDRIRPNSQSQDLSSEELELVGIWRSLPAEGQEIALTVLRDLKATTAVTHKRDAPSRVRKVIR